MLEEFVFNSGSKKQQIKVILSKDISFKIKNHVVNKIVPMLENIEKYNNLINVKDLENTLGDWSKTRNIQHDLFLRIF